MSIFATKKTELSKDTVHGFRYQTVGTCSKQIDLTIVDGVLDTVKFHGGCDGNLKGIAALVEGMTPEQVIKKLKGTTCKSKSTSCPDQLAQALKVMGY